MLESELEPEFVSLLEELRRPDPAAADAMARGGRRGFSERPSEVA